MQKGKSIPIALIVAASLTIAANAVAQNKEAEPPRPTPIGNPGAWIPADGYPAAARASAEQGRVGFTLDVDETGRVSDCKVTATSESPLLDETTCYFMSANGRFRPPHDAKGKPVASKWSSAISWKLETAPPPAPAPAPGGATPASPPAAAPAAPNAVPSAKEK